MGLAPYAKTNKVYEALPIFEDLCFVDGLIIKLKKKHINTNIYTYLKDHLIDKRFDVVAGAVQLFTENIITQLCSNVASSTNVQNFVLSGGTSMNIKVNKKIGELPCCEQISIPGSGGDESLSIGACYVANHGGFKLKNLYLGYSVDNELESILEHVSKDEFEIILVDPIESAIQDLASGHVIGYVTGRAEFGARALGHRSLLADPSKLNSIKKINEAIKNRDFWMPFALSILNEYSHEYLLNPKNILAPYMTITFDTTDTKRGEIQAGIHPYDGTCRAQMVLEQESPEYYKIIKSFHGLTGIPALLNTSFNLHGEPLVNNVEDALSTLRRSGLLGVIFNNNIYVRKK
jgi:carbamoyltransferase